MIRVRLTFRAPSNIDLDFKLNGKTRDFAKILRNWTESTFEKSVSYEDVIFVTHFYIEGKWFSNCSI